MSLQLEPLTDHTGVQATGVDLRAPAFSAMFALASEAMGRDLPLLRFDVDSGTNWNGPPLGASMLPP